MKIVIYQGGLGNQIFEYIFQQYIRKNYDNDVRYFFRDANSHNGFEIAKWFDVSIRKAPLYYRLYILLTDFIMHKGLIKNPYCNQQNFPNSNSNIYDGYWQRKMFFSPDAIHFKNNLPLNSKNRDTLSLIQSTESISIHIRRGDYLLPKFIKMYGNICTIDYYKKAIEIINNKLSLRGMGTPHFFVFSDDMNWVKENLPIQNATYIDWNTGNDSIYDMFLMSHCKHNIIANSSFSYWGARLNTNVNTVVYPKLWYNPPYTAPNIFPEEWIGI